MDPTPFSFSLSQNLLENLRRRISIAVVTVTSGHPLEDTVPLVLGRVPVQPLPVVAEKIPQRIVGRQANTNTKAPFGADCFGVDQVVLMAEIHVLGSCWLIRDEYTGTGFVRISAVRPDRLLLRDLPSQEVGA